MNLRRSLLTLIALTAALVGVFALWPKIDLAIATRIAQASLESSTVHRWAVALLYEAMPWVVGVVFLLAIGALTGHGLRWLRLSPGHRRALSAWIAVVLLGVGLLVHEGFKNHWGRPRPHQVVELGGTLPYMPPLQPSDYCARNCAFVSGHAAGAFSLMALGTFRGHRSRWRWLLGGGLLGLLVGAIRVTQGGHFLSDVLFAGLIIAWCTELIRFGWLWRVSVRRRRPSGPGARPDR